MAKNSGPTSTSIFKGILDVLPLRWRSKLGITKTEQAVELNVLPEALSTTVIASSVEQDKNTDERRKFVYTVENPTGQSMVEKALGDSGVNAAVETTSTITLVDEGDALPAYNYLTVDIDRQAFGNGKAEQKVDTVASYPVRPGQEMDQETGIITSFSEQIQPLGSGVGTANTISTPVDGLRSNVRTISVNTDALNAFFETSIEYIDLQLPTELAGVDTYWSESVAEGAATTASSASASTDGSVSASYSVPSRNETSSAASLLPTLIPDLRRRPGDGIPARMCHMYVPSGTSLAGLLTKLTSHLGDIVQEWPRFQVRTHVIVLKGQKVSAKAAAEASLSRSFSDAQTSITQVATTSTSYDISDSLREFTIGPCINPTINLVDTEREVAATAHAAASIEGDFGFTREADAEKEVIAEIFPTALPPTAVTSIPNSGLYMGRPQSRPYRPGWLFVRVPVFDAGNIPDA